MASARPLRDVFADLLGAPSTAGDPAGLLRDLGHGDLPDELVAEAVISYAETATVEVAEHLAPFVTAHSAVGAEPGSADLDADWLDLLATVPAGAADEPAELDALDFGTGAAPTEPGHDLVAEPGEAEPDIDEPELDDGGWAPDDLETDLTAEEADDIDADDTDDDGELLG